MPPAPEHIARASDPHHEFFRQIARNLRRNRLREIKDIFRQVVSRHCSRGDANRLTRLFSRAGREELLFDLLLSEPEMFGSIALIAETLTLGARLKRNADVEQWLEYHKNADGLRRMRWGNPDYIRKLAAENSDAAATLRELKYPNLPPFHSASDLVCYAQKIADRIVIEPGFLDWLYRCSRNPLPRDTWQKRVMTAFAIDHIVADNDIDPGWQIVLDQSASRHALDPLTAKKGTLFLIAHGGLIEFIVAWLLDAIPDLVITASEEGSARARKARQVFAGDDSRAALFELYSVLKNQGAVLIAPDASRGALNASITVLGVTKPMAEGAAFLAYETRCNTAWCAVEREGDRFVPRISVLAALGEKESYRDFKKRFFEFYATQIESLLTGSPDNLAVRGGWVNVFKQATVA